jgi:hypothetical protein
MEPIRLSWKSQTFRGLPLGKFHTIVHSGIEHKKLRRMKYFERISNFVSLDYDKTFMYSSARWSHYLD